MVEAGESAKGTLTEFMPPGPPLPGTVSTCDEVLASQDWAAAGWNRTLGRNMRHLLWQSTLERNPPSKKDSLR